MSTEDVVIVPYRDGPYLVRGPLVLRDQNGGEIELSRRTVALCRCGKSRMRPFCDGTHRLVEFRAPSQPEDPWVQAPEPPAPQAQRRPVPAQMPALAGLHRARERVRALIGASPDDGGQAALALIDAELAAVTAALDPRCNGSCAP